MHSRYGRIRNGEQMWTGEATIQERVLQYQVRSNDPDDPPQLSILLIPIYEFVMAIQQN